MKRKIIHLIVLILFLILAPTMTLAQEDAQVSIRLTADTLEYSALDEKIEFTITVKNTGKVDLTSLQYSAGKGLINSNSKHYSEVSKIDTLAVNAEVSETFLYQITNDDLEKNELLFNTVITANELLPQYNQPLSLKKIPSSSENLLEHNPNNYLIPILVIGGLGLTILAMIVRSNKKYLKKL